MGTPVPPGSYDLIIATWQDVNGDGKIAYGDVRMTCSRLPGAVQVTTPPDLTPPVIHSFSLSAGTLPPGQQLTISARVSDTAGGLNRITLLRAAAELVVKYGGSLSGEHGDGQAKAEFLPIMYGEELMQAFREFKAIWDPLNRMNPGKVIDPYRADENLKYGPDYKPARPVTQFAYASLEGKGFNRAIERCVGMGKCRAHEGGVMCPSYRATKEERFSTRGRARLLGEMLRGEIIHDGWRNEAVREALDLCLACKGCKNDCPTHTDMATYKAEFLHHHYLGRLRPVQAYTMGFINRWAKLASIAPRLINLLAATPGLSALIKAAGGVAQQRKIPRFARRSFRKWFSRRRAPETTGQRGRVILWADTFNNHFEPGSAAAAVEVLEALGYTVSIPQQQLCCGRPLYDFGMLDTARAYLREVMDALANDISAGVPVIGLEPACLSVFRDELPNLFPDDARAAKLAKQCHLFSDFLMRISDWEAPQLGGDALVHGHCHQKAVFGMTSEMALLKRMGIRATVPESGCCGMAGAFGFNAKHYDVSMKIGESALLPAVRAADEHTMIIASGYSCREQISQGSERQALHIAEVVALAEVQTVRAGEAVLTEGEAEVDGVGWATGVLPPRLASAEITATPKVFGTSLSAQLAGLAVKARRLAAQNSRTIRHHFLRTTNRKAAPSASTAMLITRPPVISMLRSSSKLSFRDLIASVKDRAVVVARFLAVLELYRLAAISFEQVSPLGELQLTWRADNFDDDQLATLGADYDS